MQVAVRAGRVALTLVQTKKRNDQVVETVAHARESANQTRVTYSGLIVLVRCSATPAGNARLGQEKVEQNSAAI